MTGARGGGKTDAGMVWLTGEEFEEGKQLIEHPRYRALVLRKNSDDLSDWLDRARFMYKRYGAKVVGRPARIEWPSGAIFRTGHLKDRKSYEKYLGHEYQRILVEELTQIPKEKYYTQILGSCRSTLDGIDPQIFCTTNPGGVGHLWVKDRFIDANEWGEPFENTKTGRDAIFIPAQVEDNPTLMEKDPEYIKYLEGLKETDPELYKAWRHGDWEVFAGQFFKEFRRSLHVCKPFTPKSQKGSGITHMGGVDWGYNAPFVFLAGALQPVTMEDGRKFNRMWVYREIDGNETPPEAWAIRVNKKLPLSRFEKVMCDPAMFHRKDDGSMSIADQFRNEVDEFKRLMQPANNDRMGGWAVVHKWLSRAPDGLPYLMITENCKNLIKTLPTLVHDDNRVEDIDTDGEDHWGDSLRYMLMHTKWIDGRVGGVGRSNKRAGRKVKKPTLNKLDVDAFGKAKGKSSRDWRNV